MLDDHDRPIYGVDAISRRSSSASARRIRSPKKAISPLRKWEGGGLRPCAVFALS